MHIFYSVSFYNNHLNSFNISSLFSAGIIISLKFLEFTSGTDSGFTIFSVILFPLNSPIASAASEHLVLF